MRNSIPKKLFVFGLKSIVVIFFTAMLFACENRMQTIRELTMTDTIPAEIAKGVRIIYSDSARLQMILTSPLMYQIGDDEPYIEFPDGLVVETYNADNQLVSELSAEYGKRFEKTKLMQIDKNVVVINHNSGKKLLTEQLFWNERTNKIYNSVFVTIIEKDKTIHGDSLRADQDFDHVEIFNIRGTIKVKDEGID
ncbi:MAG: LPS export ABC transporter periplasmic protein LptC [Bacteroidales bacterium]|nr:LPS export ABC transporter periplasmic protein LptC [Bacteroidales bacterium]